ncbi:GNAT family N-acetyltransferase [Clostridium uliginosum]|uniref:Protein N-acetyltransferase, RimJ/RimL family n=1 Tax=Clostridium uliginosum TaxID=119641 RepID=A0A1I1Q3G2_9CLOT|nr:GNAT family N-acetyltransferase [Clostridium uliginosum]SFD16555.1 Protein N-acetyltransferase, RimJ/RimL family [Clostridium uliginosum]
MRRVESKDSDILFKWINDEEVIKNSRYMKGKSLEEFDEWFQKRINNKNVYMFILEKENNYIGQINFEIINREAIINYSIDREFRNKGFGKELVKYIQDFIYDELKDVEKIVAYIRNSNIPSIKVFESLGFISEIYEKDAVKLQNNISRDK